MSDVVDMAEAHLVNVQREIQTLSGRKAEAELTKDSDASNQTNITF